MAPVTDIYRRTTSVPGPDQEAVNRDQKRRDRLAIATNLLLIVFGIAVVQAVHAYWASSYIGRAIAFVYNWYPSRLIATTISFTGWLLPEQLTSPIAAVVTVLRGTVYALFASVLVWTIGIDRLIAFVKWAYNNPKAVVMVLRFACVILAALSMVLMITDFGAVFRILGTTQKALVPLLQSPSPPLSPPQLTYRDITTFHITCDIFHSINETDADTAIVTGTVATNMKNCEETRGLYPAELQMSSVESINKNVHTVSTTTQEEDENRPLADLPVCKQPDCPVGTVTIDGVSYTRLAMSEGNGQVIPVGTDHATVVVSCTKQADGSIAVVTSPVIPAVTQQLTHAKPSFDPLVMGFTSVGFKFIHHVGQVLKIFK